MKVLLLDLGKQVRGGQRQVLYLARYLCDETSIEPVIVALKTSPLVVRAQQYGIPCHTLSSESDLNPANWFSFLRLLQKVKPDIVQTNDAKGASLAAIVKKIYWKTFTLIHTRRVSYKPKRGWSSKKYIQGDAIVGVSQEISQGMIACGVPEDKAYTIHSGIDTSLYISSQSPDKKTRFTIGAIGALTKQKGTRVLFDALVRLQTKANLPPWQCLVAGDGPLMKELQKYAYEQGISDNILFLGHAESVNVLEKIDILVVPSVDGEGSNAVIKEGWATGTPLIVSDLPSNLELITDSKDGLVFPNKDHYALARAIKQLMVRAELGQELAEEGKKRVQFFCVEAMGRQYRELYEKLLSASS